MLLVVQTALQYALLDNIYYKWRTKLHNRGVGLVEILVALLVIGVAVTGFSRLLLANLRSSNETNIQQLTSNATQYIIDKINANLQAETTLSNTAKNYIEVSYLSDTTAPSTNCNIGDYCTQYQQSLYDLYQWKQYLSTLKIPQLNAIVCADTSGNYGIPTLSSPNCSGSGDVVVKLVWKYSRPGAESIIATDVKYIITKIPTINSIDTHSIMGNINIANNINNASNLQISKNMYYTIVNTTNSEIYTCDIDTQCDSLKLHRNGNFFNLKFPILAFR